MFRAQDDSGRVMIGGTPLSLSPAVPEWGWLTPDDVGGLLMEAEFTDQEAVAERMVAWRRHRDTRSQGEPILVDLGILGQAAGLFAVTNIDDILVLALFFAQGAGHPGSTRRIMLGQYLGFVAILAVAVAAAFGATFLPESTIPFCGSR
ncbi:cadmium resistance transporter [Streptomyces sp. NPDC005301]|uniref:cadmium resistance transporter n=1 Tax=Streptomyces sp. NPDC005301 TaxID=3156874 RepID=UPI0033A66B72